MNTSRSLLPITLGALLFLAATLSGTAEVVPLTKKNLREKIASAGARIVLVSFHAKWSEPAVKMVPVINEVANELGQDALVGRVDLEKDRFLAKEYKVRGIPYLVFLKNGKELDHMLGQFTKAQILAKFRELQERAPAPPAPRPGPVR